MSDEFANQRNVMNRRNGMLARVAERPHCQRYNPIRYAAWRCSRRWHQPPPSKWTSAWVVETNRDDVRLRPVVRFVICQSILKFVKTDSEPRLLPVLATWNHCNQWRRHRGNGWVRTPPLLFRPLLGSAQIHFLHIGGTPCMYIVTFTAHQQRNMVRTPHFIGAGNATDCNNRLLQNNCTEPTQDCAT